MAEPDLFGRLICSPRDQFVVATTLTAVAAVERADPRFGLDRAIASGEFWLTDGLAAEFRRCAEAADLPELAPP